MNKLKSIIRGSTIGICAPAARFNGHDFQRGIQVLEENGFKVVVPAQVHEKKRYLAGEDRRRACTIMSLFSDPLIDGIICARGGFGTLRILDHLDWNVIRHHPKPLVGFSDISALLLTLIQQANLPVIHGPNVTSLGNASEETLRSLISALEGNLERILLDRTRVLCPGRGRGRFLGGNLATISHLLGTPFEPDFSDGILFLEDRGEPAYKIDRMLTQMKMAGLFDRIKGVVTGTFKDCDHEAYIPEILQETFAGYGIPLVSGLESGHDRQNLSLSMGYPVELNTLDHSLTYI